MEELNSRFNADVLAERIENLIEKSRKAIVTQVNTVMVHTYFEIGRNTLGSGTVK